MPKNRETEHRVRHLLMAVVLAAAAWTFVPAVADPPEAAAHYGSGPHCSDITSSSHGPGRHTCHRHAADYYVATTTYLRLLHCGTGDSASLPCNYSRVTTKSCRRSTRSRAKCGATPTGYRPTGTAVSGRLAGKATTSSVTIGCGADRHPRGTGCHANHPRPPCSESGYYRPHEGHSIWWVGTCTSTTTTTTATTTTTVKSGGTTTKVCAAGKHKHAYDPTWCHTNHTDCDGSDARDHDPSRKYRHYKLDCKKDDDDTGTTTGTQPQTPQPDPQPQTPQPDPQPDPQPQTPQPDPQPDPPPQDPVPGWAQRLIDRGLWVPDVYVANKNSKCVAEGGPQKFRVSLIGGAEWDVKVTFDLVAGTGAAGSRAEPSKDFARGYRRNVTIPKGSMDVEVTVRTRDDDVLEETEHFYAVLSNPSGALLGSRWRASGCIADNDLKPTVSVTAGQGGTPTPVTEGGDAEFYFTVNPAVESEFTVNVNVSHTGGPWLASSDTSRQVTIPAKAARHRWTLKTVDDTTDEEDGSIKVTLGSGSLYETGTPSSASVPVSDNDCPAGQHRHPAADKTDPKNRWKDEVKLHPGVPDQECHVHVKPACSEYGTYLSVHPTREHTVKADADKCDQRVTLVAADLQRAPLWGVAEGGYAQFKAEVRNRLTQSVREAAVGPIKVTVVLGARTGRNKHLPADSKDYGPPETPAGVPAWTLTIPTGGKEALFRVPIVDDSLYGTATGPQSCDDDKCESFQVSIRSNDAIVSGGAQIVRIKDNDPKPTVAVTARASPVEEGGRVLFDVSLEGRSLMPSPVEVPYTLGGSAVDGEDYTDEAIGGSVTIQAGESGALIALNTSDDSLVEADETVTVTLGQPGGGLAVSAGRGTATATITDNDACTPPQRLHGGVCQTRIAT